MYQREHNRGSDGLSCGSTHVSPDRVLLEFDAREELLHVSCARRSQHPGAHLLVPYCSCNHAERKPFHTVENGHPETSLKCCPYSERSLGDCK